MGELATEAVVALRFNMGGRYRMCYRMAGATNWTQIGAQLVTVTAVPSSWAVAGLAATAGNATLLTMLGGSWLTIKPGRAVVKAVPEVQSCTDDDTAAETSRRSIRVPSSIVALGALAKTDKVSQPWFAPAGFTRGALDAVEMAAVKLNRTHLDDLYDSDIKVSFD